MRRFAALGALLVAVGASSARAQEALWDHHQQRPSNVIFHQRLIRDRSFDYNEDYFISLVSYRPRYPLRVLSRLASTGYALTVGSVSTSEFILDHEARIRLPFANWLIAEFDFSQNEDYDERYTRATGEAAFLIPGTGPSGVARPLQLITNTPPPWGLFVGGSCELNAFKEFDDAGVFLGYRNRFVGGRLDVIFPAAFYNEKNKQGGEIDGMPIALRGHFEVAFGEYGPYASVWFAWQPRVTGKFPQDGFRHAAIEKARGGFEVIVPYTRLIVFDLDVMAESTSKLRSFMTTPELDDRFDRDAAQAWLEMNLYIGEGREVTDEGAIEADRREPSDDSLGRPWGARPPKERGGIGPELSSRGHVVPRDVLARTTPANWATTDVLELGVFGQYLDESTQPRGGLSSTPVQTARTLRRELYAYAGYLWTLPSLAEGLAFHPTIYAGYLFSRELERDPAEGTDRDEGFLAKLGTAVEYRFRDKVSFVGNLTFRLDSPEFGGGNVQVVFRF
ncbi:MAG: hypothetical protein ACAI25_08535 [Planctomycetota bacterium]